VTTIAQRVLVITSCTGAKVPTAGGRTVPAERLYVGEQHRRLMRGVMRFRASRAAAKAGFKLDLWILSAGHGVVRADEELAGYDTTFSGMPRAELEAHADRLHIPKRLRNLLSTRYSLALLLLGDDYIRAAGLNDEVTLGGPVLAFCGKSAALRMAGIQGLRCVVLDTRAARRFSCGLVGLKGEVGRRVLAALADEPGAVADLADPTLDVLSWLDSTDRQLTIETAA
jgi:hypothetical protein